MRKLMWLTLAIALLASAMPGPVTAAQGPLLGPWTAVTTSGNYTPRIKAASAFANSRMFIFGGADASGNVVGNTEDLTMLSKAWETKAPMPTPRANAAAVTVADDKVFVIGGYDAAGNPSAAVELFNPKTNTWVSKTPMPTPRAGIIALLYQPNSTICQIHVYGSDPAAGYPISAAYEIYDVNTNSWSSAQHEAVSGQCEASGVVANDLKTGASYLYMFSGYNGGAGPSPSAWRVDPATAAWQEIHEMPRGTIQAAAITINAAGPEGGSGQYPMIIGGNVDRQGTYGTGIMVYESGILNGWVSSPDVAPDLPEPRGDRPAVWATSGYLYIAGGGTTGGPATAVYRAAINALNFPPAPPVENPLLAGWTDMGADIPTARWYTANAVVSDKLYVIGGWINGPGPVVGNNEVYDPATNTWATMAPMPVPVRGAVAGAINGKIYVAGGSTAMQNTAEFESTLQIYDPASDSWTIGAPMPTARNLVTGYVSEGKFHVLAGVKENPDNPGTEVNAGEHETYDPIANAWTSDNYGCPWTMADASCTTVQSGDMNWAYFAGGYNWSTQLPWASRRNAIVGGSWSDQWYSIPNIPEGGNSGCTIATITDKTGAQIPIVFGGGYGPVAGGYFDKVFSYHDPADPVAPNTWVRDTSMPAPRGGRMAVAQIGDYVYIAAGMGPGGLVSATWRTAIGSGLPVDVTTVGKALAEPNGKKVNITEYKVVTRTYTSSTGEKTFWIEEEDRSAALRVGPTTETVNPGNKVLVSGTVAIDRETGARTLTPTSLTVDTNVYSIPKPLAVTNKSFGGGTTALQPGRPGAVGVNNVGMLVKVFGKVTSSTLYNTSIDNHYYFYIDDGSNLSDGTLDIMGGANLGIRVDHWAYGSMDTGSIISAVGIVTLVKDNGILTPVLLSDEVTMGDSTSIQVIHI